MRNTRDYIRFAVREALLTKAREMGEEASRHAADADEVDGRGSAEDYWEAVQDITVLLRSWK